MDLFPLVLVIFGVYYDMNYTPPEGFSINIESQAVSGKPVPDVIFTTIFEKKYSLKELKEPLILLHYWASWCTICIAEFPDLLKLVNSFDGKIALVAVSIDDTKEAMDSLYQRLKHKNPTLVNNTHVYWVWDKEKELSLKKFNVMQVPETIVITSKRKMVEKIIGRYNWNAKESKEKINMFLKNGGNI